MHAVDIDNCNLFVVFENSRYTQLTANTLMSVTRAWFCEWCVNSYIHECVQLCPSRVSSSLWYPSLNPVVRLEKVVSEIVRWRLVTSLALTAANFSSAQFSIMDSVSHFSLTLRSCMCWLGQLAKTDTVLRLYFSAVVFLHVAHKITQSSLTDEMLDVIATTCLQSNDARRCLNARHSSVLSLSQAVMLMKVVANNSRSTVQMVLVEIELSKAYLHRALRCKDSDSDSVYCLAHVYLAVLYYTTGQYQMAIDHCALVTKLQDHHCQCSSHVVQGELLPRIDDQVDNRLGVALFYQYIRAAALNEEQERRHVSVFTTELVAHYLHIIFLSVTECCQLPQTSLTG